jgi:ABC-2 type transport system permease protein
MIGASVFIIACSARNRLRQRLRRLREPRYLLGAIAGAVYLYFSFFARIWSSRRNAARRGSRSPSPAPAAMAAVFAAGPALAGVMLLITTAVSWIMPFDSGLLDFSEPEIAFLFPAPVSRRQLLIHRLMRSQLGLLFGSIVVGVAVPSTSGYGRLRLGVAMWLLLVTGKVYFTGISLARARLASADPQARRVAWLPVITLAAALAIVGVPLARAFMAGSVAGVNDALARLGAVSLLPLPHLVLWPFMTVARPFFAAWPGPYFVALGWSALVLVATVAWVLLSDEAFQDAAAEAVEKKASAKTAQGPRFRARNAVFPLNLSGRPELAFAWKAATQTMRIVDRRGLTRLVAIVVALCVFAVSVSRARGLAVMLGVFATVGAGFAILMAPQMVRMDLREDLRHLEVLKTWPVKAAAVVRGEMIWPGTLVTMIAWLFLGLALLLSAGVFSKISLEIRASAAAAAAIVAPALIFAQFAIHNGAALLFPAWVALGNQRPKGLDAMGQRLIMLAGTWLALVTMALPGVAAGAIVWLAFRRFIGVGSIVPAAAVAAMILGVEVLLVTEALGPAYERIDVTSVERAE